MTRGRRGPNRIKIKGLDTPITLFPGLEPSQAEAKAGPDYPLLRLRWELLIKSTDLDKSGAARTARELELMQARADHAPSDTMFHRPGTGMDGWVTFSDFMEHARHNNVRDLDLQGTASL